MWLQSSLGESEKRLKALQETVQQRGAAVPFLSRGNQSAQVGAMLLLHLSAESSCVRCLYVSRRPFRG